MKIIVGLGNPGKKYEFTRHNIGFRAVDEIAANFQFPVFKFQSIFNAQISKGEIAGKKIILAKPQTFMNLSGKTVKSLITNYLGPNEARNSPEGCLPITNLWVVHDDIDLSLGEIRIVIGRGAAGHKGVASIIKELKTKNFIRFRIGIKPNEKLKAQRSKPQFKTKNLEKFVLKKFNKKEEKFVKEVIQNAAEAIEMAIEKGIEKTMNKYN